MIFYLTCRTFFIFCYMICWCFGRIFEAVGSQYIVETVATKSKLHAEILFTEFQKLAATGLRQVVRRTDIVAVKHYARDED